MPQWVISCQPHVQRAIPSRTGQSLFQQDKYAYEVQKCGDRVEIFNIADRRDKEMREIIDGLFEEPVCDSIFGSMNLYAMADGLHVWTNFLLALMDETDSAFAREQKATNPRIQKYTAKYRR